MVPHQGALLFFQQATSRTFLTTLSFKPSRVRCCVLREVAGNLCYWQVEQESAKHGISLQPRVLYLWF